MHVSFFDDFIIYLVELIVFSSKAHSKQLMMDQFDRQMIWSRHFASGVSIPSHSATR